MVLDSGKSRAGCCWHHTKTISMSRNFLRTATFDQMENIFLHEIAHALVGEGHGHDRVWKHKAVSLGCDGQRCLKHAFTTPKWTIGCRCGKVRTTRHRLDGRLLKQRCDRCLSDLEAVVARPSPVSS